MSTGLKFSRISYAMALSVALLCFGWTPVFASPAQQHVRKKAKKQQAPPPPLPSGPTGVVPQVPLDRIAAVPPEVTFRDNQLTIVAPNSTLADILRAVRKQTGAEIDVPNAPERVVTRLGPGSARDIIADLLNGSRFNYVLLGAPDNDAVLTRVVLVPKGPETNAPAAANQAAEQPGIAQPNGFSQQPAAQPEAVSEPEANADDSNNNAVDDGNTVETPAAEADQPPPNSPDQQQAIKTPQQMLQEMQQRQMQLQQQQQQQGQQAPPPGSGMPPHPPQEQ
jgi:hypothetical protein